MCLVVPVGDDTQGTTGAGNDLQVLLHVLSQIYLAKLRSDKDDDAQHRSHLNMVTSPFRAAPHAPVLIA